MRVVYDSEAPAESRVTITLTGNGHHVLEYGGCFDIKVEITDPKTGKAVQELHLHRWGSSGKRNEIHKRIAKTLQEKNVKNPPSR